MRKVRTPGSMPRMRSFDTTSSPKSVRTHSINDAVASVNDPLAPSAAAAAVEEEEEEDEDEELEEETEEAAATAAATAAADDEDDDDEEEEEEEEEEEKFAGVSSVATGDERAAVAELDGT